MKRFLDSIFQKIGEYNTVVNDFREASEKAADPSAAYVNWGIKLAQDGDIKEALLKFQKAAEMDPNRSECHSNWGITLVKAGRINEAIAQFKQAVKLDPIDVHYYGLLGAALVEQGELDEANQAYEAALSISPQNHMLYRSWGVALARQNNYDEAISKFKQSLSLRRYQPEVFFMWGAILAEQGRYDEAIHQFRVTLRYLPKHEEALYFWCLCLNKMGDYDKAILTARECIMLMPNNADVYIQLGHALAHTQQPDEAIANYRHALMLDESLAQAHESWGMMLVQQEKYDEAYAQFEKALALEPERLSVHGPWGQALVHQKNDAEALKHLEIAHAYNPNDVNVLVHWAAIAMRQSQNDGERPLVIDKLFELEDQHQWNPQIHYLLGIHYLGEDAYQKAVDSLTKVIDEQPDFLDAGIHLSLAYCGLHNTEAAVRVMRPFIRQYPQSAKVQFFYGHTLYQHGDLNQARDKFNKAIELDPHYLEPQLGLAEMDLLDGHLEACKKRLATLTHIVSEHTPHNQPIQHAHSIDYLNVMLVLNEMARHPQPTSQHEVLTQLLDKVQAFQSPSMASERPYLLGFIYGLMQNEEAHHQALLSASDYLKTPEQVDDEYQQRFAAFWHECWEAFHLTVPPEGLHRPTDELPNELLWTLFRHRGD